MKSNSNRKSIILTSLIDVAIVLTVPFIFMLVEYGSLTMVVSKTSEHALLIFGICIPVCVITGWRGASHTKRLLTGQTGIIRPLVEGFALGFSPVFIWMMGNALNVALAAGNAWDDAKYWGVIEWLEYTGISALGATTTGLLGMLIGGILSIVNRAVAGVVK